MFLDQSITGDELGLLRPIQLVVGCEYVSGAALSIGPAVSSDDRSSAQEYNFGTRRIPSNWN